MVTQSAHFLMKYRWEVLGFLLLLCVVLVNRFPEGYVIAGEDMFQNINLEEHYARIFYDWQGRASLFYGIFYFFDRLGFSETWQLSGYVGIFLIGAYLSFLAFCRLVFQKSGSLLATLSALFYALNLYTLYVFTYGWGYSDFQVLYVFIPILTGTYIRFLTSREASFGVLFLLTLFFASTGFSNPAFAVALLIYLFLLLVLLLGTRLMVWERQDIRRLSFLIIFSVLVSAYWILPLLPQVKGGVTDLAETNSIHLGEWLQKTSTPISETVRLGQFNSGSFFPKNNPYKNFPLITPLVLALSFLPILFVLVAICCGALCESKYRKLFLVFFGLFVIFIALNARVRPPFEALNNFLFHTPGLNTLRSYEKIAIFTPFLLATLLMLTLMHFWTKRILRPGIVALMVLILLLPLPFYLGKLQQNMSFILSQRSKNFQKSSHSFLVKIPQAYYDIRTIINSDSSDFKIASLPYNTTKLGWVSYPKWKLRGSDITSTLYQAPLINPNAPYLGSWLFAQDFNEYDNHPLWIVELLGILNTKYVLYHKDVHDEFMEQSQEKIQYLKSLGALQERVDNEFFVLYEIPAEYRAPYVYRTSEEVSLSRFSLEEIQNRGEKIRTAWRPVSYEKRHEKKVTVSLSGAAKGDIVLSERFDPLWQATYLQGNKRVLLERDQAVTYANAWKLTQEMQAGQVIIEYLHIKLFFIGAWVSGGTLLGVILYGVSIYYGQRRKTS